MSGEAFEDQEEGALGMDDETVLSATAMGASVIDQLRGEMELTKSPVDYLSRIDDQIRYLMALHSGDEDVCSRVRASEMRFYGEVAAVVASIFGTDEDSLGLQATVPTIYKRKVRALYNFMVVHRYRNVVGVMYAYVIKNKKELAKELKVGSDRKDPTISGLRRSWRNFDDVVVMYHVPKIVDSMIDVRTDEFVDLLTVSDGDSVDTYLSVDCITGLSMPDPFRFYAEPIMKGDDLRASLEADLTARLGAAFEKK
jgi:hypothetical protein